MAPIARLTIATINPIFLLVLSRALDALRPALLAFLIANAASLASGTHTPISFCNVLFVGNLCAAITVVVRFGWRPIWQDLNQLSLKLGTGLVINGCLAALLASLIFLGLYNTTVTNAVLLARLGPVLYALAGTLLLGQQIKPAEWFGYTLIVVGIGAIVLKTSNFQINQGDLLILGSAVVYATTSYLGKFLLAQKGANLRLLVFSRNMFSALIFFVIASVLFGPVHFSDVFSGQLWVVMAIYALVVIVLSQFFWYAALDRLDSQAVGKWSTVAPVFGVVYAFLLNGERPSVPQVLAFVVIMVGLLITNFSKKSVEEMEPKALMGNVETSASAP
jgi:drug/metabolite transporter (DMT)-like permease